MGFWRCIVYLAFIGVVSFWIGRLIPKKWIKEDRFPYRSYSIENNGKLYERIKIRAWQTKVPDMSRIFRGLMPAKKLDDDYCQNLPIMIKETCVAELIHFMLCILGLNCFSLWKGVGGVVITLLYILCNVPFILIQRYNRPRLIRLQSRYQKQSTAVERECAVGTVIESANFNT